MVSFSPRQIRYIQKTVPFIVIWLVGGLVYALVEKGILGYSPIYPSTGNPYNFSSSIFVVIIGSIVMGALMGYIEVKYLKRMFDKYSFGSKLILKPVLYLVFIICFLLLLSTAANSIVNGTSPLHPDVTLSIYKFITNFAFLSVGLYAGTIIAVSIFISEISDNVGHGIFRNFLLGTYHKPRTEERIFMFLDLRSSTTIAEKLGHVKYYELLNSFYHDVTNPIIDTLGEIYQYAGDEVVISWSIKDGFRDNNCIECFYAIKKIVQKRKEKYMVSFGLVPEFKAGLHYGNVTAGEIGVLKKEIVYTGDVLNTTARIQNKCNENNVDLLLSQDLLTALNFNGRYRSETKGETQLRGRDKPVKLFTLIENQKTSYHET